MVRIVNYHLVTLIMSNGRCVHETGSIFVCGILSHCHTEMSSHRRRAFGQRSPPVAKLIRDILGRYPDGQIFKV